MNLALNGIFTQLEERDEFVNPSMTQDDLFMDNIDDDVVKVKQLLLYAAQCAVEATQ